MLRVNQLCAARVPSNASKSARRVFSQWIQAENLFLRRQLALYIERGVKPRRIDPAKRIALILLSQLFDWRGALTVVRPQTLIWTKCQNNDLATNSPRRSGPPYCPEIGIGDTRAASQ